MSAAEQAIETVVDAVEVIADNVNETSEIVRKFTARDINVFGLGVSVGLLSGAVVGYFVTKKHLEVKFRKFADDEIAVMAQHYRDSKVVVADTKPELADIAKIIGHERYSKIEQEAIAEANANALANSPISPEHELEIETTNVFDEHPADAWDYATEIKSRIEGEPYIIHKDERDELPEGYDSITLSWYEGDYVLADHRDKVIDDVDSLVGLSNLDHFGHGSGDPNTVLVRNDRLEMEIEIVRSDGKYAHEVHGFEDELQHSEPSRHLQRRARWDDE